MWILQYYKDKVENENIFKYQFSIGKLKSIEKKKCPNIAYDTNRVAWFSVDYCQSYNKEVNHITEYLHDTIT